MGQSIEIPVGEEKMTGWLSLPPGGQGKPVLVLHAWWGLNGVIRDLCDRLAAEGFVALAPDVYHGDLATTIPQAEELSGKLDGRKAVREDLAALAFLLKQPASQGRQAAVIGFSLGAWLGFNVSLYSGGQVDRMVAFYGTFEGDFGKSNVEYLVHLAEEDPYATPEEVEAMKNAFTAAGTPHTIHVYPGTGHWFFEPDRPDAYNQAAADMAMDRTLAFLRK